MMGSQIQLEDIVLSGIVSLISGFQLTYFAKRVGIERKKHRVPYPQMTGNVAFERVVRAQQNTLEFHPIFMVCMWLSALFFNQVMSAVLGVVYIFSRHLYFKGYSASVQERLFGFKLGTRCLMMMATMAGAGMATTVVRMYTGVDLAIISRKQIQQQLGVHIPW